MIAIVLTLSLLLGPQSNARRGYGQVEFANSGSASAQADFLEGLALLHDFEYDAAASAFQRAQEIDPSFAMAYWGEAMTFNHPIWMQQDLKSGRAALQMWLEEPPGFEPERVAASLRAMWAGTPSTSASSATRCTSPSPMRWATR